MLSVMLFVGYRHTENNIYRSLVLRINKYLVREAGSQEF